MKGTESADIFFFKKKALFGFKDPARSNRSIFFSFDNSPKKNCKERYFLKHLFPKKNSLSETLWIFFRPPKFWQKIRQKLYKGTCNFLNFRQMILVGKTLLD